MKMTDETWSVDKAKTVFGVGRNDLHFLDISEDGELCITLSEKSISIKEIVQQIKSANGKSPGYVSSFTLRIPQLITYQIKKLRTTFEMAFEELEYSGEFIGIYPVKVNQRSDFVTAVIRSDSEYGLEAGTKAELLLITSVIKNEKHRRIVCNGAKDPDYLRLIRESVEKGFKIAISIESLHEAQMIVDNFDPKKTELVFRIKPYLNVEGHWSHSTGRDSKFGLSIHDLYNVVDLLSQAGFADSVTTILGHAGSQITDIDSFRRFGQFLTSLYSELRDMGLTKLANIDFGGGLAIDYTGKNPQDLMYQYARNLTLGVKEFLSGVNNKHPAPNIMIESGRGITALAALVIVEALEVRSVFPAAGGRIESETSMEKEKEFLEQIETATSLKELVNVWNEFHSHFGGMTLAGLGTIFEKEMMVGKLEKATRKKLKAMNLQSFTVSNQTRSFWHPEHIVVGNFSVFNSIADHVLVDQHFPVIPSSNLHVQPETTVRLVDITCDSDGEIAQFYRQDTEKVWYTRDNRPLTIPGGKMGDGIPVGKLDEVPGSHFILALVGAYQDAIEMDHNLLGDLPDVELALKEDNTWGLTWLTGAESIEHLLKDVGYADIDVDEDPYMDS
jgi:arginine decarboxylase